MPEVPLSQHDDGVSVLLDRAWAVVKASSIPEAADKKILEHVDAKSLGEEALADLGQVINSFIWFLPWFSYCYVLTFWLFG